MTVRRQATITAHHHRGGTRQRSKQCTALHRPGMIDHPDYCAVDMCPGRGRRGAPGNPRMETSPMTRLLVTAMVAGAFLAAACSADDDAVGSVDPSTTSNGDNALQDGLTAGTTTATISTTEPVSASTSATSTAATSAEPSAEPVWTLHEAGTDCMCADGSPYTFSTRSGDPSKVLIYFQGGGACFSEAACNFETGTFKPTTGPNDRPSNDSAGIWDVSNPANPFADWTVVFMPYCTGDIHRGNAEAVYSDTLTVQHRGGVNARHSVDYVSAEFPSAERIFVTGSSAGGVPTPWIAGLMADEFPDADVAALADSSGGYSRTPDVTRVIGGIWGVTNALPDWPEIAGLPDGEVTPPDLFKYAGLHAPDLRLARFDFAWDDEQVAFAAVAGLPGGMREVLDANEALSEDAGVRLDVYVAAGTEHTILARKEMYSLVTDDVLFIDWLTAFVDGEALGDVICDGACGRPAE